MIKMLTRAVLSAIAMLMAVPADPLPRAQRGDTLHCRASGALIRIDELAEASGIAASRRTPGTLWVVNDSEQPVIYALDAKGAVTGRVRVTGATVEDWEAIGVGPCQWRP